MRWLDTTRARLGISAFILFTGWAGDAWRNLIGWYGFGVVVLLVVVGGVLLIVSNRARFVFSWLPLPLAAFLVLATLSIAWSQYRLASVLGVSLTLMTTAAAVGVALALNWSELLRVLGWVFRAILSLSFLFELVVSLLFRAPVLPVWLVDQTSDHPAQLLYWSRNLLFSGGKIQGIVGNSSLLAMAALVALIVFSIQFASASVSRVTAGIWIVVALAMIVITRSATVFVGAGVTLLIVSIVLLLRRTNATRAAVPTRFAIVVLLLAAAVTAAVLRGPLLAVLGKSDTLTGRVGIWDAVIGLAQQHPAVGWGWVSWWAPWVAPFDHLIRRGGVQVLHAHNAWLDIWLQLGVLGLIVFGALVLTTYQRSWQLANDRVRITPSESGSYSWLSLLPLLVLSSQLVQSLAESRILIEGGWMLLVIFAVMTKRAIEPTTAEKSSGR